MKIWEIAREASNITEMDIQFDHTRGWFIWFDDTPSGSQDILLDLGESATLEDVLSAIESKIGKDWD